MLRDDPCAQNHRLVGAPELYARAMPDMAIFLWQAPKKAGEGSSRAHSYPIIHTGILFQLKSGLTSLPRLPHANKPQLEIGWPYVVDVCESLAASFSLGQISSTPRTRNAIAPHVAYENANRKTKNQNGIDHEMEHGSAPVGCGAPCRQFEHNIKGCS
jgi:hypothetical protein